MTGAEIQVQAKAYGTMNDNSLIDDAECVNVINEAVAERVGASPHLFAVKTTISAPGAATPYDLEAEDVPEAFRVEKTDGTKVNVVSIDQPDAAWDPRLQRVGQLYYAIGSDPDPSSDDLVFYHGDEPDLLADINETVWSRWRERWRRILELEVAIMLAIKDGRDATGMLALLEKADARFAAEAARAQKAFDQTSFPD